MADTSPLDHTELRHIEKTLDEGNTQEAAMRLSMLVDSPAHKAAIDFLTTRLLFQRGRIDLNGAADRLGAILQRVSFFPEAEDWLIELEARTERSALDEAASPAASGDSDDAITEPPQSRAPSVPRSEPGAAHPYVDEVGADDDVTPTESRGSVREAEPDAPADSSEPPPRRGASLDDTDSDPPTHPNLPRPGLAARTGPPRPDISALDPMRSESPTRPDVTRPDVTRPDVMRPDVMRPASMPTVAPPRPSHMPFDNLRAKEQLSALAGRYRGGNDDPGEVMGMPRRSRAPAAARASNRVPPSLEQCIQNAAQYLRDGLRDMARASLPDDSVAMDLPPELRALLARTLLELGHAERAAAQATLALDAAPALAETRLVFVWSAVRYARQRDDAWSFERAGRILKELHQDPTLEADLVDALTSCIEARIGTPAVALRLAQRALRTNADSIDGLAALAEAAALCGEERRSEAALERLFTVSEAAAEAIAPRLSRLGVGGHGPASSASVWLPLEHILSSGAREAALSGLELLAEEALAGLAIGRLGGAQQSAELARQFFSLSPVLRHFGPYDLSLKSIERLEVGLGLLYGSGPRPPDVAGVSHTLWQLAGIYLGETIRQCCGGRWQADPELLKDAALTVLDLEVQPFQIVRHRIAHGRHATLKAALDEVLQRAPPAAHGHRAAAEVAPSPPWGDRDWPALEDLPRLGRALGHSVVAVYATEVGQGGLDRSVKSLEALDRYIQLVAPENAPLAMGSSWARWLAVFLGAYLGEVLCKESGGVWAGPTPGDSAFIIEVGERRIAPVDLVLATLGGQAPISLAGFARELRRAPSNA